MKIDRAQSPNFNDRMASLDMLVLHYTGMKTGAEAIERLCDPEAGVSAHYVVEEDGRILQLVDEDKRAWHAGVSRWQGDEDLNSRSIGIEIVNGGHDWRAPDGGLPAYPAKQIDAVTQLSRAILKRWDIPQTRIVGHSDIAPARKQDPGEHFPWQHLSEWGVGFWPDAAGDRDAPIAASLAAIGYDVSVETAAIAAFQRRWRPGRVDGCADQETAALADAIARHYSAG